MFVEECKYVVKEKKMFQYIIDDIEISSDSGREDCVLKNHNKENSDKETFNEKKISKKYFLYVKNDR